MNWPDERYVRVYTRDTGDWLLLSFEAQSVWLLMLRKFDRSGTIYVGRGGRRMLAAVLGHPARQDLVDKALDELIADGCCAVSHDGGRILAPNFRDAQDWVATPAERVQKHRERRRAGAGAKPPDLQAANVTLVTPGNVCNAGNASETPAVPCLPPVPPVPDSKSLAAPAASEPVELVLVSDDPRTTDPVEEVLGYYLEAMSASGHKLEATDTKRKAISRALKWRGVTVERLKRAVDGLTWSDWHMGRTPGGKCYLDLKYAMDSPERIEARIRDVETQTQPKARRL